MPFLYSNPYITLYVSHSGWWSSLTWRHFCWRQVVSTVKIFNCGHEFPAYTTFFHVGVSHLSNRPQWWKENPDITHPCLTPVWTSNMAVGFSPYFYNAASTFIKYFTNDVDFHIKSPITFCLIRYNITVFISCPCRMLTNTWFYILSLIPGLEDYCLIPGIIV